MRAVLAPIAVIALAASPAFSQVTTYSNRSQWSSAVGSPTLLENFEGFLTDTSFRTALVNIAGGQASLSREGADRGAPFDTIDVPPYGGIDAMTSSGSTFAYLFTDAPEGASSGTQVRLTFNTPIRAFGMDVYLGDVLEGLTIEIIGAANQVLGTIEPTSAPNGTFAGFVSTNLVTSLRFRSTSVAAGGGGEAFGIDNLAGSPVPAPSAAGALMLGLAVAGRRRR